MIEYEDQTEPEDGDALGEDVEDDSLYVIMIGDMSNGYRPVGPFESFDIAHTWSQENIGVDEVTWILPLYRPYSPEAKRS